MDTNETTEGCYQLNFVKLACEAAQLDLTDFFQAWGFLTPIDRILDDYGKTRFTITRQQIDLVIKEIAVKNYPKPKHGNIYAIQDDNVSDYKDF